MVALMMTGILHNCLQLQIVHLTPNLSKISFNFQIAICPSNMQLTCLWCMVLSLSICSVGSKPMTSIRWMPSSHQWVFMRLSTFWIKHGSIVVARGDHIHSIDVQFHLYMCSNQLSSMSSCLGIKSC
jgi:hypothetical protein